jgi:hypothetical protein
VLRDCAEKGREASGLESFVTLGRDEGARSTGRGEGREKRRSVGPVLLQQKYALRSWVLPLVPAQCIYRTSLFAKPPGYATWRDGSPFSRNEGSPAICPAFGGSAHFRPWAVPLFAAQCGDTRPPGDTEAPFRRTRVACSPTICFASAGSTHLFMFVLSHLYWNGQYCNELPRTSCSREPRHVLLLLTVAVTLYVSPADSPRSPRRGGRGVGGEASEGGRKRSENEHGRPRLASSRMGNLAARAAPAAAAARSIRTGAGGAAGASGGPVPPAIFLVAVDARCCC